MKVFLSLCLLFSLVTPAVLLTCEMCDNKTGIECSSRVKQNCADVSVCKSAVVNGSGPFNITRAKYACVFKNMCDPGHYAITTANGVFFDMVIDCCTSNLCNSKELELPLKEMEPNELECVGCYSLAKGKCEGTEVVKCRGDQTKCIKMDFSYRRKLSDRLRKLTVKGCATPDMCQQTKVMKNRNTADLIIENMTAKCSNAL